LALSEYERKRHFNTTPEPTAKLARGVGWSYVVQKHAASHLHYDFRLELDGVLKSWAVPKGPSLDPAAKRLAMEVEDHPVEYGGFEGIIPQDEYGGGTVLLWDAGQWEPIGDPREGYIRGKLKFTLHGQKLSGGWSLIRTHNGKSGKTNQWLLIKEQDDSAISAEKTDILIESPLSVVSRRSLKEIAASPDRVWASKKKAGANSIPSASARKPKAQSPDLEVARTAPLSRGVEAPLPSRIDVQLATLTKDAPDGDEWLHEIKFDGYRMICRIDGKKITFLSRNHQDWTGRLGALSDAVRSK
jgi:bifunctional non-homologous end joining protein LigD